MAEHPPVARCPDADLLEQYAHGAIAESVAESLHEHLAACQVCQTTVDRIAASPDSMLNAMRLAAKFDATNRNGANGVNGAKAGSAESDATTLQAGKNFRSGHKTDTSKQQDANSHEHPAREDSLGQLLQTLDKSGLISKSEVRRLLQQTGCTGGHEFANALVRSNRLTRFQAAALLRGRYKGLVLGNYVVLEKLGSGGMGNVFRGRHVRMGRIVCIKVLRSSRKKSAEVVERFRLEAKTMAALNHPNFVIAHDADESAGIPFLVMEYIAGRDLARHVRRNGPLDVRQTIDVLLDVASALTHAHRQGIVHRDIKPHNLMLGLIGGDSELASEELPDIVPGENTVVKILDLGLARYGDAWIEPDSDSTFPDSNSAYPKMTSSGIVMGTIDYISPEQALNGRNADARSDIYSLGCTLFFLLTGRVPFGGETMVEKLLAHREDPIPLLRRQAPGVSHAMEAVFRKMLAKDPALRYQSMQLLAEDLRTVRAGGVPLALKEQGWSGILRYTPVRLVLIVVAAIASFALAGAASWYLVQLLSGGADGLSLEMLVR